MSTYPAYTFDKDSNSWKPILAPDLVLGAIPNLTIPCTNANAGAITLGMVVYKTATAAAVDKARANNISTCGKVLGLVNQSTAATTADVDIMNSGLFEMPDWTSIIGDADLTPGSEYFVDPDTAGKLVEGSSGFTTGEYAVRVGIAVSVRALRIDISDLVIQIP